MHGNRFGSSKLTNAFIEYLVLCIKRIVCVYLSRVAVIVAVLLLMLLLHAPTVCKMNFTFYDVGSIDVTTPNKTENITQDTILQFR